MGWSVNLFIYLTKTRQANNHFTRQSIYPHPVNPGINNLFTRATGVASGWFSYPFYIKAYLH